MTLETLYYRTTAEYHAAYGSKARNIVAGKLAVLAEVFDICGMALPAPVAADAPEVKVAPVMSVPEWIKPHLHRLGVEPDYAIAVDTRRSRERVRQVREALGLDRCPAEAMRRGQRDVMAADLAKIRSRLGTVSDYDLAAEVGRSQTWVQTQRAALGIAAMHQDRVGAEARIATFHAKVGTVPDRVIAEMADCHPPDVCLYRKRHGILAWKKRKEER